MTITITTVSLCSGTNHVTFVGTAAGSAASITISKDDLSLDPTDNDAVRAAFIARVRSAVKEANASTLSQMKTALEGKTFKL